MQFQALSHSLLWFLVIKWVSICRIEDWRLSILLTFAFLKTFSRQISCEGFPYINHASCGWCHIWRGVGFAKILYHWPISTALITPPFVIWKHCGVVIMGSFTVSKLSRQPPPWLTFESFLFSLEKFLRVFAWRLSGSLAGRQTAHLRFKWRLTVILYTSE